MRATRAMARATSARAAPRGAGTARVVVVVVVVVDDDNDIGAVDGTRARRRARGPARRARGTIVRERTRAAARGGDRGPSAGRARAVARETARPRCRALQAMLASERLLTLPNGGLPTGFFGPSTTEAVKKWQKLRRRRTDGGVRGRLARGVPGAEEDGALRERLRAATALASVAHRGKVWETDRARCAHWYVDEGGVFIRQRRLRGVVPVGSAVYGGDFVSTQGAESMEGARGARIDGPASRARAASSSRRSCASVWTTRLRTFVGFSIARAGNSPPARRRSERARRRRRDVDSSSVGSRCVSGIGASVLGIRLSRARRVM